MSEKVDLKLMRTNFLINVCDTGNGVHPYSTYPVSRVHSILELLRNS